MPDRFLTDTIDAELAPGARNAIRVCLRLQPNERITIITDEATAEIAAALQAEVEEVGAPHAVFVLENYAEFYPKLKWLKTSGLITPEKWGNLPGGEIFTSPKDCKGIIVVDGVVGDYLCAKYGDLAAAPLTVEVENSRIRSLRSENKKLLEEFRAYTSIDENSNRVGEFAIGTNTACTHVIGNILQDEKIPGIHVAFGHPYAEHTGADWISKTHIDCVARDFDIWFDGEQVMQEGKFLV